METVLLAIVVLLVLVAAMSIGVIMGRKPIKGSCGGVAAALGETDYTCPVCGDDPNKCEKEQEAAERQQQAADDLAYNAVDTKRS